MTWLRVRRPRETLGLSTTERIVEPPAILSSEELSRRARHSFEWGRKGCCVGAGGVGWGPVAVRLGTWIPFARIPELLRGFIATLLSEPTIRRLAEVAGAAHVAVQTAAVERLERRGVAPSARPAVLQVSVDGAMVSLRGEGEWAEVKTLAIGTA